MQIKIEQFAKQLAGLTTDELITIAIQLKTEVLELKAGLSELRKQDTIISKDYQSLKAEVTVLRKDNNKLISEMQHLQEVNEQQRRQLFGVHSEKLSTILITNCEDNVDPIQEEIEAPSERTTKRTAPVINSNEKRKPKKTVGKRKATYDNLPTVRTYELNVDELNEKYGEYNWHIYRWNASKRICYIRTAAYVKITFTPSISFGLEHETEYIPPKDVLLKNSFVSSSLAAAIMYNKFMLSLPLYRQQKHFEQLGLPLSRQTMSNWILYFADTLFAPVYEYLCQQLNEEYYTQCDETPFIILKDGRNAGSKSYIWVHRTGELLERNPVIVACAELHRSEDHLQRFYKGHKGNITCDAYSAYSSFKNKHDDSITISGCFMHCRRRFAEAFNLVDKRKIIDEAKLTAEEIEKYPELKGIMLIYNIYKADEQLKDLSAEERLQRRQSEVKPLVEKYFRFVEEFNIDDPAISGKLKDAVKYSRNQKEYLCRFLDDPYISIDNGSCLSEQITYPTFFLESQITSSLSEKRCG